MGYCFSHSFIFLISVIQTIFGNGGDIIIISPEENCPGPATRSCFTLASCLRNTDTCFTSNSVITFSPGDHSTEDLYGFVTVEGRENLTLKVEYSALGQVNITAMANIVCSNGMGFAFLGMDDFTIMGLRFLNCGAPIPQSVYDEARRIQTRTYYYFFRGTKITLFMANIFNLVIDGIHINNSDGYGMFIINALGVSSISNSQFTYSNYRALHYHQYNVEYCDAGHTSNITSCTGGNLVVLFQDEPQCH